MTQTDTSSKWTDLAPRVLSAIAMAAVAVAAIWIGGLAFRALIAVVIGLCIWELAGLMKGPAANVRDPIRLLLGALAAATIWIAGMGLEEAVPPAVLLTPKLLAILLVPLGGMVLIAKQRLLFALYSFWIMLAGLGFLAIGPGPLLIWFILIIIISDVAGYFMGRIIGGPKFWPRISPKKTWSGTIAGWIGALALGWVGVKLGYFTVFEALFAPLLAFAGQLGDIAESAIKRRMGVKDSSNLIPGHGGVLDRFDAMIGAAGAIMVFVGLATLFFTG